jgi:NAD(P)-dependent dehydrogenase (short-subunit alcohol dehydrogenase family)
MSERQTDLWIVTGAVSGIGAAVTRMAAAAGANVLALDISDAAGNELASAPNVTYRHCDVSNAQDWDALAANLGNLGQPTRIHLNAGIQIAPPNEPLDAYQFESMTMERYRRMMGVNVDGVVFGLRALLPLLQPESAIVVTASLAGITPYSIDPLYAMSKHAVVGLVRSLAPTLIERGIRINALCPGGVDTNIIPHAQRTDKAQFMTPECLAEEVIRLMDVPETGKTWAKVAQTKPAFIVRAPGDKG